VIREVLGRSTTDQIAVLSGPSFAREVALSHPTAVTLSASNPRLAARAQKVFSSPTFRLFLNPDMIGVQAGGALKNVMALAAGISDGLGFGCNTKAILMARGLSEMARLGVAMGAEQGTFFGLSGMGDLFLTCSGALSRNREVGQKLGEGMPLEKIREGMKMVAEGVYTTESAHLLGKRHRVSTPIIRETYRVLFEDKPPRQAMLDLLKLARGRES
jgi:glycerol-3-phosphate dehydrogenase (NAD(P)+)